MPPLPQTATGFPNIPGVTYNGLKTTRYLFNYGPDFYATGIPTINPPVVTPPYQDNPANGPIYPSFVPKTDRDGNDIAGVRLPDVTVPLATYTGWALRAGAQASDGCEAAGQYIPFPKTKADRIASGDPRLSIEERYPTLSAVLPGDAKRSRSSSGTPDAAGGRRRPAGAAACQAGLARGRSGAAAASCRRNRRWPICRGNKK